jgi:hypothetical protein
MYNQSNPEGLYKIFQPLAVLAVLCQILASGYLEQEPPRFGSYFVKSIVEKL